MNTAVKNKTYTINDITPERLEAARPYIDTLRSAREALVEAQTGYNAACAHAAKSLRSVAGAERAVPGFEMMDAFGTNIARMAVTEAKDSGRVNLAAAIQKHVDAVDTAVRLFAMRLEEYDNAVSRRPWLGGWDPTHEDALWRLVL